MHLAHPGSPASPTGDPHSGDARAAHTDYLPRSEYRARRKQERLARARQREWALGSPDDTVGTGRPGMDKHKVDTLTDALRTVEGERRVA